MYTNNKYTNSDVMWEYIAYTSDHLFVVCEHSQ